MSSMALVPVGETEDEKAYDRLKADPAVTVADIQGQLGAYCEKLGVRNMQEVIDEIDNAQVNWKTAPQAATQTPTTTFSFRSCL